MTRPTAQLDRLRGDVARFIESFDFMSVRPPNLLDVLDYVAELESLLAQWRGTATPHWDNQRQAGDVARLAKLTTETIGDAP